MEYSPLGRSGLLVSKYVFGTLTFAGTNGFEALGSADAQQGRRMIDMALDAGVNAIDTANLYSKGDSEVIVGKALAGRRDRALVFSKAASPMAAGPNDSGASRQHLSLQIEDSLRRLQTDYLDLYFIHRWDGVTPVEETVQTMSDLVRAGKIRYWGVSNYSGWQVAKTVLTARQMGAVAPVAHQLYYTPAAREAEYELIPAGDDLGLATMVWSPLGQGLLSGRVGRDQAPAADTRQGTPGWLEPYVADPAQLYAVIDALQDVAGNLGVSAAQIALAWIRQRQYVHSVVIGARTEAQLQDNLASAGVTLDAAQMAHIEQAARPAPLYPFWHRSMWALDRPTPSEREFLQLHRKTMGLSD
ncbi:TPA: aldo/keto reductase [Pseudomonas putida]